MRVLFILPVFRISGGAYIVAKVCGELAATGIHEVIIAVPDAGIKESLRWLEHPQGVTVLPYSQTYQDIYDVVVATWWETLFIASRLQAKTYALFMQALESSFYEWGNPRQEIYDRLVGANVFPSITTARWTLNYASQPAFYFLAGLDRSIFKPTTPFLQRGANEVRFLLEGPISDARKNIKQAIDLLEQKSVNYVWVGAEAAWEHVGTHCQAIFSDVPLQQMAAVYSSADVMLKISSSEGMFGPPLEMFACGGTAICWDVSGAEEYMAHGCNSLLCPINNFSTFLGYIDLLRKDRDLLGRLKAGAKNSANAWPSWFQVRESIFKCFDEIAKVKNRERFLQLIDQTEKEYRGRMDFANL
jgi:glycosyltransferase involved in cell wall biosynthesis